MSKIKEQIKDGSTGRIYFSLQSGQNKLLDRGVALDPPTEKIGEVEEVEK